MGTSRNSILIVFSIVLLLSLVVFSFEPAEAKKSSGNYLTEISSAKVCGDKLCAAPQLIFEEKIL